MHLIQIGEHAKTLRLQVPRCSNDSVENNHPQKRAIMQELSKIQVGLPNIFTDATVSLSAPQVKESSTGLKRIKFTRIILQAKAELTVLAQMTSYKVTFGKWCRLHSCSVTTLKRAPRHLAQQESVQIHDPWHSCVPPPPLSLPLTNICRCRTFISSTAQPSSRCDCRLEGCTGLAQVVSRSVLYVNLTIVTMLSCLSSYTMRVCTAQLCQ